MPPRQDNIVIKKVKKVSGHGHHGGAWKVAYADFVTAMMAFFLLLWLLNATTKEQRQGISNYFAPSSVSTSTSGSGGILAGTSMSKISALQNAGMPALVPVETEDGIEADEATADTPKKGSNAKGAGLADKSKNEDRYADHQEENKQFEKIQQQIKQEVEKVPELAQMLKNLMMEITPEGLRIQIVDQDKQSMFDSGSANLLPHTAALLGKVAGIIKMVPNAIAITGHTDGTSYPATSTYTNWELSADRAQATRRSIVHSGVPQNRIAYVSGRADRDLLIKDKPLAPMNRRISITLMYNDLTAKLKKRELPVTPIQDGVFHQ
jgi:chemotaxis protein MotB